ncbi:MAG: hypothetical protein RBR45_01270 [Pseudomonas sp.]|jgi:hypothetical protein|nr:hypothetical protein [Pseudomonas sp.]
MKFFFSVILSGSVLLLSSLASATSEVGQHYIDRIANGGPSSVRDVARSIQKSRFSETEVLDVLAERLIQDYQKGGRLEADAMAWAAIALGSSGNSRYYDVLAHVANTATQSKVAKHTKKSLKKLEKTNAAQYTAGQVSLADVRNTHSAQVTRPVVQDSVRSQNQYISISKIHAGMSQAEVNDLAGPPTSTRNHITGKAFIPFNFKGSDTVRIYHLYKGQGKIVFSNESAYSSGLRVREVIIDPSETGYP